MKQGQTKKQLPKDKHTKASWKKRDEGRKGKQEAYAEQITENIAASDAAEARVDAELMAEYLAEREA